MVACLALMAGVSPCSLMSAAAVPGAHDCCDKPDPHSGRDSTDCETRCAQAAERVALQDGLRSPDLESFEFAPAAAGLPTPVQDCPARAPLRLTHAYPHPSLYILNASFLI
jgi:hypothetical protein